MPAFKGSRKNSIVLVLGDLNARGLADVTHLAARDQSAFSRVKIWNSTQFEDLEAGVNTQTGASDFGPEVSIARTWTQKVENDDETLYILKYGVNNVYLDANWTNPSGVQTAVENIISAALASPELDNENNQFYLCWVHGEYDAASASNAANYETSFPTLISWLETEIQQSFIKTAICRISTGISRTDNDTVRTAQQNIANSSNKYYLIDTDDCGLYVGSYAYYDSAGQFLLGERVTHKLFSFDNVINSDRYIFPIGTDNQYIDLPQDITTAFNNASSFEISYKLSHFLASTYYIFDMADGNFDAVRCWLSVGNTKADINNVADITDTGGYDDNQPHQVVVTWDGVTLSQSIDGNTPLTASNSGPIDVDNNGRLFANSLGGGNFFGGHLGDFRIKIDDQLIVRYETSDGIDSSGQNNHATVFNGPIRQTRISELYRGIDSELETTNIQQTPINYSPLLSDAVISVSISNSNDVVRTPLESVRELFFDGTQTTFDTLADLQAATINPSINRVEVLGYANFNDGGYQQYERAAVEPTHLAKAQSTDGSWWEMVGDINASAFGALPTNSASNNNIAMGNWAAAVSDLSESNYVKCFVPPGTYELNPFLDNANEINGVTFDPKVGGTIDICGYGAELKWENNAFSGMIENSDFRHMIYIRPSRDVIVEGVRVLGFTVNGNLENQPDPITQGGGTVNEYEQASLIKHINTSTSGHMRFFEARDITILDPMADGLKAGGTSLPLGRDLDGDSVNETLPLDKFIYSNIYEGPRGPLAKRSTVLSGRGVREVVGDRCFSDQTGTGGSIQTEFTLMEPTVYYRISLSQCDVGWFDFAGDTEDDASHYEVNLSQCKSQKFMAVGWTRFIADQCDFRWSDTSQSTNTMKYVRISDSIIRLGTDGNTPSNETVSYLGNTETSTTSRENVFDNVEFIIDSDEQVFLAATCFDIGSDTSLNYKYRFNNCKFDPRFHTTLDCYAGGHLVTRNCIMAGTVESVRFGTFNIAYPVKYESHNDDFSGVTEVLDIQTVTPPSNAAIYFYGGIYPSNLTGFIEGDAQNDYDLSVRFSSRVIPVSNITTPPGGGLKGDIAWNYKRDVQWRATSTHPTTADWVQLSVSGPAIDRKNNQDTLSNDVSNIDFTTGDYDNKEVTFTQDANLILSTTDPGFYGLLIKSDDGSFRNLSWDSDVLGDLPSSVSGTIGTVVRLYYDGTNFHA